MQLCSKYKFHFQLLHKAVFRSHMFQLHIVAIIRELLYYKYINSVLYVGRCFDTLRIFYVI